MAGVCPPVSFLLHYYHSGTSISACASKYYPAIISSIYILFPSCISLHLFTSATTDSYSPFLESLFDWNLTKQGWNINKISDLTRIHLAFWKGEKMCVFYVILRLLRGGIIIYAFLSLTIKKDIAAVIKVRNSWTWQI